MPVTSRKPKPPALWPSGMLRPGGLPGWVTLQATCQNHLRPGGTSHLRGRQKPNWLSLCLSGGPTHQPNRAQRLTGGFLSHLIGQAPMSHPFTLSQGASPVEQPSAPTALHMLVPEQSPRPKRWHPSPKPMDNMPLGRTTSKATSEGPPGCKWWEVPPWIKVLKQSCSEPFSWDTNLVRRLGRNTSKAFLQLHCRGHPWPVGGLRWMAESAELLGSAIYEIQRYGQGQTNCSKLTMPWSLYQKASSSSMWYPHLNPQRVWDWWAYTTQMPLFTSMAWPTVPGVGEGQN